jgi:hypothetical protein
MIISAEVTVNAKPGCAERASEVTTTGPNTEVEFIIDESSAYAVLRKFSGTMSFHNGRTDKLIGGAEIPSTNAVIKIDSLECIEFRAKIKDA